MNISTKFCIGQQVFSVSEKVPQVMRVQSICVDESGVTYICIGEDGVGQFYAEADLI